MYELLEPAFVPVIPRKISPGEEAGLTLGTTSSLGETAIVIRGIAPGVNPLKYTDPDGNDIVVLNRSYGAGGFGHNAVLVGNNEDGWVMYSKDGLNKNTNQSYKTLLEFIEKNASATRKDRYDRASHVSTTKEQDKAMQERGNAMYNRKYAFAEKVKNGEVKQNCADLVADIIDRTAIIGKQKIEKGSSTQGGYEYGEIVSPIDTNITWPNRQFEDFSNENSGAFIFALPWDGNILN